MTKEELITFLKENLVINVDDKGRGWGSATEYEVSIALENEEITSTRFWVRECR